MRSNLLIGAVCGLITALCPFAFGQGTAADDPVRVLVGRLDLERYKATIKGLTEFGDRRQGTDRNRAAVDWIERCAIAIRPLPPVAEFGQSLDRGLVPLQIKPSDQYPDRVVGRSTLAERERAQRCDQPADCTDE